jgi:hypothetical protein
MPADDEGAPALGVARAGVSATMGGDAFEVVHAARETAAAMERRGRAVMRFTRK